MQETMSTGAPFLAGTGAYKSEGIRWCYFTARLSRSRGFAKGGKTTIS